MKPLDWSLSVNFTSDANSRFSPFNEPLIFTAPGPLPLYLPNTTSMSPLNRSGIWFGYSSLVLRRRLDVLGLVRPVVPGRAFALLAQRQGLAQRLTDGGPADGLELADEVLGLGDVLLVGVDQLVEQALGLGREPDDLEPVAL